MRLLFDEHLSPKLVRLLGDLFPGSAHVQLLGLRGRRDRELWSVAKAEGFTIVSRDSDFELLALSLGAPPKIVLLRTKDGRTSVIEALLRRHAPALKRFDGADSASVLLLE